VAALIVELAANPLLESILKPLERGPRRRT